MLGQICRYLRNWFDEDSTHNRLPSWSEEITISDGELVGFSERLKDGQYFRIFDSARNNGVYLYPATELKDETFTGTVQSMNVDPEVVELAADIEAWQAKYGGVDSVAMSPYSSESFSGYSYSKYGGSSSGGSSSAVSTWQSVFAVRLAPWRKI